MIRKTLFALCALAFWSQEAAAQCTGNMQSGFLCGNPTGAAAPARGALPSAFSGVGTVVGPASATDNAVVRFDLTTGKLIQNSTAILADTGALTLTVANAASMNIRSGAAGSFADLSLGRTANELDIGVAIANAFTTIGGGTAAGDGVFKSGGSVWIVAGGGSAPKGLMIEAGGNLVQNAHPTAIAPAQPSDITTSFRMQGPDNTATAIILNAHGASGDPLAVYETFRSRGTAAVPLGTEQNDILRIDVAHAYDGVAYRPGPQIRWVQEGAATCSVAACGSQLQFHTMPLAGDFTALAQRMVISAAGFVGIGNGSPKTYLDINANTTTSPALQNSTSLLRLQAADGNVAAFELVAYGGGSASAVTINTISAGGTAAAPSATLSGSLLYQLQGLGYTGSVFSAGGYVRLLATELWSGTARGTAYIVGTTPNGTAAGVVESFRATSLGGLAVGLTTETTAGVVNVLTGFRINSAAASGNLLQGNGTNFVSVAMSGDATIASGGAITIANNAVTGGKLSLGQLSNSIGANVALNNTANYFDGPTVAQGSTGTWFVTSTINLTDTTASADMRCKLWDGTTVISASNAQTVGASQNLSVTLSGYLATPAGNLRVSCRDLTSTSGFITANGSGNGNKDSSISAFRIN